MDQDLVNRREIQFAAIQEWLRREHLDTANSVTQMVAVIAATLGADRVGIWLIDSDDSFVNLAQFPEQAAELFSHSDLSRDQQPVYFAALEKQNYLAYADVEQAKVLSELIDSYYRPAGIASMLDLPVRQSGKLIGVLCIDSLTTRNWLDDEIQFAGSMAALVTVSVETSDRRAADRRLVHQQRELQRVLDSMVEGVITVGDDGMIIGYNMAAEKILGYGPGELMSVTVMELSQALADSPQPDHMLTTILDAGVKINDATQELQARRKDGSLIFIRLSIAELPVGPDGRLRYVGSFLDITAEKEQQERLRRSEALESLGHLSGGIAHDFNNMLGIVLGYAELIHGQAIEKKDGDTVSKAEKIIHAGRRGTDLTRRLLAFSRRSPGAMKSVDVNNFLNSSAELLRKTLTPRIKLTLNCQDGLWPVYMDPGEFEDAILNLAVNAMHAIDQRGELELRSENLRVTAKRARALHIESGHYVKISAIDNGSGMDEATLARVFEPFFTSRPGEGSGLGLSQVYGFIQRVNGGVFIESGPGKGTRVELYFPKHSLAGEAVTEEFSSGDRPAIKHPGRTVLVVDDEPALRQLVETVLNDAGYQVTMAENGVEALALADEQVFDLVLSDVIMPIMDGYQLSEALLKKFPRQRISLMSGYEQSVRRKDGYATAVALRKPFTSVELLKVVNKALAKK